MNSCSASTDGCITCTFSPRKLFEYDVLSTPSNWNAFWNARLPLTLNAPRNPTDCSRGVGRQHAWRQQRELVVVAAVQRQLDDLGVIDDGAAAAGLGLEHRRFTGNLDLLGYGSDGERDVEAGRLIDLKHHAR